MKRKVLVTILILCLLTALFNWLGVGEYCNRSAVLDLEAELESIHGEEYTGKAVDGGTEDMEFVVAPRTWFLTNWNLRNALGLDYEYECKVVFTTHTEENETIVRIITYQGVDPMGAENTFVRAHLDINTKEETTETTSGTTYSFTAIHWGSVWVTVFNLIVIAAITGLIVWFLFRRKSRK